MYRQSPWNHINILLPGLTLVYDVIITLLEGVQDKGKGERVWDSWKHAEWLAFQHLQVYSYIDMVALV